MLSDNLKIMMCCECEYCVDIEEIIPFKFQVACCAEECILEEIKISGGLTTGALSVCALLTAGSGVKVKGYEY